MFTKPTDELKEQLTAMLNLGISQQAMEKIKKAATDIMIDIEDDIMYRLKDDLAPNLSAWVEEMATKTINTILQGNEEEMRRYLSCQAGYYTGRDREHTVIHGKLFEDSCITLRRQLVEAHRDLITSERILDLEAQLASLVAQNIGQKSKIERLMQELRNFTRD